MIHTESFLSFCSIALMMVLSPGPNMIYLISRSIGQGKHAGLLSLVGVGLGLIFYFLLTICGVTNLIFSNHFLFEGVQILGAIYLLWLAWKELKPKGASPFEVKNLANDKSTKLVGMGFLTSALNPNIAMIYITVLPQFINPEGNILNQSILLGSSQIAISLLVNALIVIFAAKTSHFLKYHRFWSETLRYVMGISLLYLAIKIGIKIFY